MRFLQIMFFALLSFKASAQEKFTMFAAARSGLSIREQPDVNAKVLDKIPYGSQVMVTTYEGEQSKKIVTEGFNSTWAKVTYNNKTGYIVSAYLFPVAPPKSTTKDLKRYLAQLAAPIGAPIVLKYGKSNDDGIGQTILTKQFFKNGGEWHEFEGYEYGSYTYIIPEMRIEQAWMLLRLLECYPDQVGKNDPFPASNSEKTFPNGSKKVVVEKETFSPGNIFIKKIKIESDAGAIYNLEIYELDNQVVIYFNGGV